MSGSVYSIRFGKWNNDAYEIDLNQWRSRTPTDGTFSYTLEMARLATSEDIQGRVNFLDAKGQPLKKQLVMVNVNVHAVKISRDMNSFLMDLVPVTFDEFGYWKSQERSHYYEKYLYNCQLRCDFEYRGEVIRPANPEELDVRLSYKFIADPPQPVYYGSDSD